MVNQVKRWKKWDCEFGYGGRERLVVAAMMFWWREKDEDSGSIERGWMVARDGHGSLVVHASTLDKCWVRETCNNHNLFASKRIKYNNSSGYFVFYRL